MVGAAGMLVTWKKDIKNDPLWYGNKDISTGVMLVRIEEPPIEKPKSLKALVSVRGHFRNGKTEKAKGQFIVYFAKDSLSEKLKYGDLAIINKKLQPVKNAGNPGEFDYARYLANQQIYHQVFVQNKHWRLLDRNKGSPFYAVLFKSREYVVNTIGEYISGINEAALAKALLIGYRQDLEKDLVQAYSNAGVVHLIAISGLHMALLYGFLLWIFLRIPFFKRSNGMRLITILCCLWFFALLTGAPPSVMRAAVMFSFISAGTFFKKNASVFNSLSTSALVLLCIDPFVIWNVGFQLSYLAVLGIVILLKPIYSWFYFKNKILDYGWQTVSVSLAAQVFTVPVCIYYFHQLPLLFILSNIIAIPLATVALWGSIALLIASPIYYISFLIGQVVTLVLWLMNQSVIWINKIPFVTWENFDYSVVSVLILYGILFSSIYALLKRNKTAFKTALAFCLIFMGISTYEQWKAFNQKVMVVYNIPSKNAIDFFYGNRYRLIADTNLSNNNIIQNFHLKPVRLVMKAKGKGIQNGVVSGAHNFYQFLNKKIVIIDSSVNHLTVGKKIKADYIIISNNPKLRLAELADLFHCDQVIFSSTNSMWKIGEWKRECEELHLRFHSVSEQGAFVIAF